MPFMQNIYAAGTPYTLTIFNAPVTFGTTSPQVTFRAANGTRIILARVVIDLSGAMFADGEVISIYLRRTNHTPADVPNSLTNFQLGIWTPEQSLSDAVVEIPPIEYTLSGTPGDVVKLYASIDDIPHDYDMYGEVSIREASIIVKN
jgi:hypothetical protein